METLTTSSFLELSTSGDNHHVATSLMKSVMTLKTQSQGDKILCNIQAASMEIAALLEVRAVFLALHLVHDIVCRAAGILQSEFHVQCPNLKLH